MLTHNRTLDKFVLGEVFISPKASLKLMRDLDIEPALQLHLKGHWGHQDASKWKANDRALSNGEQLESVFHSRNEISFTIITDLKLHHTRVLLTEEVDE